MEAVCVEYVIENFYSMQKSFPDVNVEGFMKRAMSEKEEMGEERNVVVSKNKIEINPQFAHALQLMEKTNQSLFITGKAGTGKSTLLDYFCLHTDKIPVVLAPTGVAALNVKGQTIHRFFNFYIDITPQKVRKNKPKNAKLYKKLKTIIIDEVSMLRADLLDCIDTFLQMYGPKPNKPFGGVQMIFVGDLYQLPPVVRSKEKEFFSKHYKTPYFFSAQAFDNFEITIVELEKVYRQKDQGFIDLLNGIRNNSIEQESISRLNDRYLPDFKSDEKQFYISLTTTNKKADQINDSHLQALPKKLHSSEAIIIGDFGKEYSPTAVELQFKVSSQIMLLNNDQKKRWVNGSVGVIKAIKTDEDEEKYLEVILQDNSRIVSVYPFTWEVYRFSFDGQEIISEPIGKFTQFPIRLAWAITIHKSQGKTFDRVIIDIGHGTFVAGQMYVALSRCTSFKGIVLKTPIKKTHIRTDYRIFDFLTGYQYRKAEEDMSVEKKIKLIQTAINEKNHLEMTYLKANDIKSRRIVIPLNVGIQNYKGKEYQGMQAYCTKRQEERIFRVDRILNIDAVWSNLITETY